MVLLTGCGDAASGGGSKQTPAEFAGILFDALVKNDAESFKRLYQQDMGVLVPFMRKVITASAKAKKREIAPPSDAEITANLEKSYFPATVNAISSLRSEGEKLGVDWSQISDVKAEQWRPTDMVDDIPLADCRVTFASKGKKFEFMVGDATQAGGKWFTARLHIWKP